MVLQIEKFKDTKTGPRIGNGRAGTGPDVAAEARLWTYSSEPSLLMPRFVCNLSPALSKNHHHWRLAQGNAWIYAVTFVGREYISWMWVGSVGKEGEC